MANITKLRAKQARLQAVVSRAYPKDSHLDAVSRSFHLGTVGGSGHNTAALNRRREASLERTITSAVKNIAASKELAWVNAQIAVIEERPAVAERKEKAEAMMTAHGQAVAGGIKAGDMVQWVFSGTNCKVIRVNRASVTVEMCGGEERLKFNEITRAA